ncbi:cytochrome c3 family protein [Shewanella marisflavi]|uniref:cytochrome c3 family protein n=1 Tax=Shewanella marisflavi TaxID=260364 RepID=UPI00200F360A|nr:cytochrome c3 family protein [Shewanella marisflavi]MCL1041436.1 cytochrome c3 family protein [Shewanella marisflavi]
MLRVISALCLAALLSVPSAQAMKLKDYHKEIMTNEQGKVECSACHGEAKRKSIPKMSACESCHGTAAEMAELTKRPEGAGHSVEPNPHDSLHYGSDLPCTYCHQEHKESKVYCNQCHEFKYPKMKR